MARDKYHSLAKNALINEGWEITNDPLRIPKPSRPVEIDLGAEKISQKFKGRGVLKRKTVKQQAKTVVRKLIAL